MQRKNLRYRNRIPKIATNLAGPQLAGSKSSVKCVPSPGSHFAATAMSPKDWQTLCAERKQKQVDSIPTDWIISLPQDKYINVQHVPEECGLLSVREIEISNTTDVDVLLSALATGVWSSVEVTTAFYKRAIIAHQLVRLAAIDRFSRH